VRFLPRIFALLTFLGWLFATGHVAFEHRGMTAAGVLQHEAGVEQDHHEDAPDHDGDHHEHDLMAFAAGQFAKTTELKALAPVWVPLADTLVERLLAMAREAEDTERSAEDGPPLADERLSGWLLVVQTALPVRGPSLI
jgi:hypothetical protein